MRLQACTREEPHLPRGSRRIIHLWNGGRPDLKETHMPARPRGHTHCGIAAAIPPAHEAAPGNAGQPLRTARLPVVLKPPQKRFVRLSAPRNFRRQAHTMPGYRRKPVFPASNLLCDANAGVCPSRYRKARDPHARGRCRLRPLWALSRKEGLRPGCHSFARDGETCFSCRRRPAEAIGGARSVGSVCVPSWDELPQVA